MKWVARTAFGVFAAALATPVALGIAATSRTPVTASPNTGGTHTRFVASFRAPASTSGPSTTRRYVVSASTGSGSECASEATKTIDSATAGLRVRVVLGPGASRAWCVGIYRGTVRETITPKCGPGEVCPQFIAISPVGTFSFRVK